MALLSDHLPSTLHPLMDQEVLEFSHDFITRLGIKCQVQPVRNASVLRTYTNDKYNKYSRYGMQVYLGPTLMTSIMQVYLGPTLMTSTCIILV